MTGSTGIVLLGMANTELGSPLCGTRVKPPLKHSIFHALVQYPAHYSELQSLSSS